MAAYWGIAAHSAYDMFWFKHIYSIKFQVQYIQYSYGTGFDKKLKAYINHFLKVTEGVHVRVSDGNCMQNNNNNNNNNNDNNNR